MDPPAITKKRKRIQKHFREHMVKAVGCRRSNLRSFLIDQELIEDNEKHRRELRILLLGNAESGRNTMVKQLRIHFGDGFPTSVRKSLIPFITANLSDAVVSVLNLMQNSDVEITDSYAKNLAAQLIANQPTDGYTGAVSFAYYNNNDSNNATDSFDEHYDGADDAEAERCGDDYDCNGGTERLQASQEVGGFSNQDFKYSCPIEETENERVATGKSPHKKGPNTPVHAKLLKSLNINEIIDLFGSLHPEVDWRDVLQSEVFSRIPVGIGHEEALTMWFENAFKKGKLNAGKVMAALQERALNPHIGKLPPQIAAILPPPNQTPPTPPAKCAVDLESNILTDSDDWSSTTSVDSKERNSLMEDVISVHLDQQMEDKSSATDCVEKAPYIVNVGGQRDVLSNPCNDLIINPLCMNGRILKLIIDRPEFQQMIHDECEACKRLSKSSLYFIHNVDRFIQNDYDPALRDILLVRMPSTAMRESVLQIGPTSVRLINVGDQCGDRRKWIHYFESIHAVLFFAALTDFSELSVHSRYRTRLDESLAYFRFLVNALPIAKKDIILFFTKKDLLSKLLVSESSASWDNPETESRDMSESFASNQRELFLSQCPEKTQKIRHIFVHSVCLLDIDEMKNVCRTVMKEVFDANLRKHVAF